MDSRKQFDGLLLSYLSNEASAEEAATVIAWINSDEQNRLYFEEVKNAWRLTSLKNTMDKIDVDFEWDRFKQTIAGKQAKIIDLRESQEPGINENEASQRIPHKKKPNLIVILSIAAAASILLFLGMGWGWFSPRATQQPIVTVSDEKSNTPASPLHFEKNNSGKEKKILLEDGSEVVLANNSELSYLLPFTADKRDINLTGMAKFTVAKDKARPFTVYNGDIATTALGTQFTIVGYPKASNIVVTLFEGKVVIKSIDNAKGKLEHDFYLEPGQQLVYNKMNFTAKLNSFGEKSTVTPPVKKAVTANQPLLDNPSVPKNRKGTWYMFNNQPLSDVFEQLQAMYNVEIVYSKKDVSKIYFIGEFQKADSIAHILHSIAFTNNLKVSRQGDKFLIKK